MSPSQRTIYYGFEIEDVNQAKEKLSRQTKAVIRDPTAVDNPVTAAIDVAELRSAGEATERALAYIVSAIDEIRHNVEKIGPDLKRLLPAAAPNLGFGLLGQPALRALGPPPTDVDNPAQALLRAAELMRPAPRGQGVGTILSGLTPEAILALSAWAEGFDECADCGQPIIGEAAVRSSDSKPVHKDACPSTEESGPISRA